LGFQVGDTVQQLTLGINPAIVFAQQAGQTAQAVSLMGGKMAGVATFLSGPWGAAVIGAVTVLGLLSSNFFRSRDAAKEAGDSVNFHKLSTVDLIAAIRELDAAQRKQIETTLQSASANFRKAEAARAAALEDRQAAKAALERAIAEEQLGMGALRRSGSDAALQLLTQKMERVTELRAQLIQTDKALAESETTLRRAALPILQNDVREATDAAARANGNYERTLVRLNSQLTQGALTTVNYRKELEAATRARDKDLKAIQDAERNARASTRDAGRTVSFLNPVDGPITSGFGPRSRPTRGASTFHPGIDFGVPVGTAVRAPAIGVVELVGFDKGLGKFVVIDHGGGTKTKFGHLSAATVSRGDMVSAGDIIARSGNTGISTGPHLDYRVQVGGKYVDPRKSRFRIATGDAALDAEQDAIRAAAREAKEAKRALEELAQQLAEITRQFDPARAAAADYAATLAQIDNLQSKGLLSDAQQISYSLKAAAQERARIQKDDAAFLNQAVGGDFDSQWRETIDGIEGRIDAKIKPAMDRAGRQAGEAFRDSGVEAAQAISQLFGGKIGNALSDALGVLSGLRTGNFNSVNSPLGSILTLLSGGPRRPGDAPDPFSEGLEEFISPMRRGLKEIVGKLGEIFKIGGDFEKVLGHAAGGAALGSVIGPGVTSLLGLKGSNLGGQIGGALGSVAGEALKKTMTATFGKALGGAAGPIGSIVGSILGSALGGILKGSKRGSATITSIGGEITTGGNSGQFRTAATGMARNVQDALSQIAEALGGSVGGFAVSLGVRDGKLRVDPSGRGQTKTKRGAIDFGQDEAGALSFAIADAIADGAVIGLSAAVQKALRSNSNIDRALREALKVDEVEALLEDFGGTLNKTFRDFERQAAERVRIARQYGFDVLKIESINAKERAALVEDILGSRIGSLKALLDDLAFGDLFEGSLSEQRDKLLVEIAKARGEAETGVEGAADKLADLSRRLIELSREAFGTAGGEFAFDRQSAISSAQKVIELESARVKAATDAANQTNTYLNENNNQNAEMIARLAAMEAQLALIASQRSGGSASFIDTSRHTVLR
jgi:murein DD-endopeptidase MepM/ murein hydrolase activator NlpD